MDCTQTAQKMQTPQHVHLEVTFVYTLLANSILKITGNFPYNRYQQFNRIGIKVTQIIFFGKEKKGIS